MGLLLGLSAALLFGCGLLLGDVQIDEAGTPAAAGVLSGVQPPPGEVLLPLQPVGAGSGLPPLCDPGQTRCQGPTLEACSVDALWAPLDVCATAELCELGRASGGAGCVAARCSAGERVCEGDRLRACNAAQTEFEDEQTCSATERCDPRRGCDRLPCTPGERRCNGASIEVCDAQAGDFVASPDAPCATSQLCEESAAGEVQCLAPVCPAGEFRCAGSLLQRCSDGRDAWLDFQSCATAELCVATRGAQGCSPPACEAGALRCAADTLERCRPGRDGVEVVAQCASAGGCDPRTLACRDPCVVGGARCVGATLATCDDVLVGWQGQPCVSAELCNAAARSCERPQCQPSDRACRGAQPMLCAPGRTGLVPTGEPCASVELCDGTTGRCQDPACAAGETACQGADTLLTCNASRTGFDAAPCAGLLGVCDPGPPAACRSLL